MINLCLIGAGRIGQIHARNIANHPGCQIMYVSDVYEPAARELAKNISAEVCDVSTALQSPEIDAVIICSSTDTHSQYCIHAADAGKAIFCEKPLDLNLARASSTELYVRQKNVVMALGFNRRFDPHFSSLRREVDSVGKVEQINIISRDPSPPPHDYIKVSGGLFKDMMIHDFDIARWLLPEEPTRLVAMGKAIVDPSIVKLSDIDTAMVNLETPSGIQCNITNSRRTVYGYDQRVEVFGSKGLLSLENQHVSSVYRQTEGGQTSAPIHHFFLDRYKTAYINEMNDFIDMLNGKDITLPGGKDGVAALRLAEAANASLESGCFIDIEFD